MANTYSGNVIFIDTSAAFSYAKNIDGIKLLGGSTGASIVLRSNASSTGDILWQGNSSVGAFFEDVKIRDNNGIYAVVTGSATALVYLSVCD